jgi:hypothetical protein
MSFCAKCGVEGNLDYMIRVRGQWLCMQCVEEDVEYWRDGLAEIHKALGSLLAIVHREGGHHVDKVGWVQATNDAVIKIQKMKQVLAENNLLDKSYD